MLIPRRIIISEGRMLEDTLFSVAAITPMLERMIFLFECVIKLETKVQRKFFYVKEKYSLRKILRQI